MLTSLPFPPEEGIGNYVLSMSKQLLRRGHSVTVITRGSGLEIQEDLVEGVRVMRAPYLPLYPFHVHIHGLLLRRLLKNSESQFDILHVHSPLAPTVRTTLPIVTTIHTPMIVDSRYVRTVDFRSTASKAIGALVSFQLERSLMNHSRLVTTVSDSVAGQLEEYGLRKEDVVVVGNGVDTNTFKPIARKTGRKYVLYTGRLSYRKGLFDLTRCARYVCREHDDVRFVITGKGPLLRKLQKSVKDFGIQDRVHFIGHVSKEELVRLLQNATVFAFPSHYEGLPTSLLEAMACGLPIVATEVSGNKDLIRDRRNGILVPSQNPQEMARGISRLLCNQDESERLGKEARRTVEENYTWEKIAERMLGCYEKVVHLQTWRST